MSCVAIITARGGSRRIPGKNIREFCGKPIIAYSIEAAIESGVFDEVMVSTDSDEIARIAEEYGASVPFKRSAGNAGDTASTADVIKEVLTDYRKAGKEFDSFVCLYPTAPFITAERLKEAADLLSSSGADAVVPIVRYSFPVQRSFIIEDGRIAYRWPEYRSARSQDLTPFYHDCGQFYFVRTDAFDREGTVVPANTAPMVLPETQVQDIDNPEDWSIAEMKYRMLRGIR